MIRRFNSSLNNGFFRTGRIADSETRRGMRTSIREGIPATIINNLLGGPLQTAYLLFLGFRSEQIGLITAIPSLTLVIQIFIALAMQRWSNRRLLLTLFATSHRILWVLTGLIPLLFPHEAWFGTYVVLYLFSYILAQSGGVIWTSLLADMVPPSVRGRYFGIRNTIHWAVASLTLFLGGQWMQRMEDGFGFAVLFSLCALCMVWNSWELTRHPNPAFIRSGDTNKGKQLSGPLKDRAFRSATLFVTVFLLAQNVVVPLFSFSMLNVLELSYSQVTLITMLQNIVMMISYPIWGSLNSRYPAQTLLLWVFPLISIACASWAGMELVPALLVLCVSHILLGLGLGGYNLLIFNFLIGDTPKSERPMYVAVFSALTGLAGFLGPNLGGWLFQQAAGAGAPDWLRQYGIVLSVGIALLALSTLVAPRLFRRGG
ncbi:MFS transporter [Cohnella fermenti]|uniref:MFS transporter n=1 Tax=Cohnella fermenti TaxID=2565925 RepID=A0A4S4BFP5_9BACL|nr:MFS transporter [Cohnella fermenti]THF73173.1 MFS transporter [Cohnella fermenti]